MSVVSRPLCLAALLGAALAAGGAERPAPRPNVVLILSDDQGWTDYGFMGHPQIRTPNLDRLAAESLLFTRGYTAAPLCRPALASLITGRHVHEHRICGNDVARPGTGGGARAARNQPAGAALYETLISRIEAVPTLPRLLASHGYRSFQAGKWWEGAATRGGFTGGMTHGDVARGGRHGDVGLGIGREAGLAPVARFLDEVAAARQPFFLWYAPMLPHDPHDPPAALLEAYRGRTPSESVARYWANCERFDATCGELLALLEARGLRDNTIVFYTCDNGWVSDPAAPNRFAPRSKNTPYEGGIRTPVLLRWPGRIPPRRDNVNPVSNLDFVPTVLGLLGVERPAGLAGLDLTNARAVAKRPAVFGSSFAHNVADLERPASSLESRWLVTREWKLIAWVDRPAELFALRDDPGELTDCAAAEPRRVRGLRRQLDAWWTP